MKKGEKFRFYANKPTIATFVNILSLKILNAKDNLLSPIGIEAVNNIA